MIKWITRLFKGTSVPEVIETVIAEPTPKKTPAKKKTTSKKGTDKCDFSKLTKTQLLAEAKHRGVKANASMNKADILAAINKG